MIYDVPLEGELVRLRPMREHDVPLLFGWYSDPDVRHWSYFTEDPPGLATLDAHRERFEMIRDDPAQLLWCIESMDGRPLGDIALQDIQPLQKRADLAVSIGEKSYWGRGYGSDAIRLALRFAFEELDCRRVTLVVDRDNTRAIRCYEKAGFLEEGVLREHRLRYGEPVDMIAMAVLRDGAPRGASRKNGRPRAPGRIPRRR
ncbi:MAG: GNAT family N-acetyltransferase [Deltaproteobacteria bacterium]|nr:GNAT family N-acetyltransferase [Deltaproteobacteria bacterium]MBW2413486.1 GNAT family N-acetyltransferase [Deltaproteobacteria bacterium]